MKERDGGGRFAKGTSGNARGRPRSRGRLETIEDLDRIIIDVCNRKIVVTTSAGKEKLALIEANVVALAHGTPKNRLASNDTIAYFRGAAARIERRAADEKARREYEERLSQQYDG